MAYTPPNPFASGSLGSQNYTLQEMGIPPEWVAELLMRGGNQTLKNRQKTQSILDLFQDPQGIFKHPDFNPMVQNLTGPLYRQIEDELTKQIGVLPGMQSTIPENASSPLTEGSIGENFRNRGLSTLPGATGSYGEALAVAMGQANRAKADVGQRARTTVAQSLWDNMLKSMGIQMSLPTSFDEGMQLAGLYNQQPNTRWQQDFANRQLAAASAGPEMGEPFSFPGFPMPNFDVSGGGGVPSWLQPLLGGAGQALGAGVAAVGAKAANSIGNWWSGGGNSSSPYSYSPPPSLTTSFDPSGVGNTTLNTSWGADTPWYTDYSGGAQ